MPTPDETAAAGRCYVYAIVPAGETSVAGPGGIGDCDLAAVSEGRLAAVVSPLATPKIRPERRNLAAHQEVLKRLLAETTPLPLSFGAIAGSTSAVRKFLARHQRPLLEQLRRVSGKVEMGLRVTWDVPNIFEYLVNTHPDLRAARDTFLGNQREPTQEEKIEIGRMFDRLLAEDRESHREKVEAILSAVCLEIRANKCRQEHEVMNLACLVARQRQESFGEAVMQAAQLFDHNFAFDYSGPWAPHNFVHVDLRS